MSLNHEIILVTPYLFNYAIIVVFLMHYLIFLVLFLFQTIFLVSDNSSLENHTITWLNTSLIISFSWNQYKPVHSGINHQLSLTLNCEQFLIYFTSFECIFLYMTLFTILVRYSKCSLSVI